MKGKLSYGYPPLSSWGTVIRSLAAREVDTDAFVSTTFDLDVVVEKEFEALEG